MNLRLFYFPAKMLYSLAKFVDDPLVLWNSALQFTEGLGVSGCVVFI